jgi:hypothetical protein
MNLPMKQPAITKHPKGTASFNIRVRMADGATWEACTWEPQTIENVIEMLSGDFLGYLRDCLPQPVSPDPEKET